MLFKTPQRPTPFVKWVGGKRSLAPLIADLAPDSVSQYWEPFVGGGAVFFHLEAHISTAHLSDTGPELVLAYQTVRDNPGELIELLQDHAHHHADQAHYYRVRAQHNLTDPVAATARFLYLNRTCYNGLYRVNRRGEFNVARGSYQRPVICDPEAIMAASMALRKAQITLDDFQEANPGPNNFAYCDPPHDGTFDGYTTRPFRQEDQTRLRNRILEWAQQGAQVMCSNADTDFIRRLYSDEPFHIRQVSVPRTISADGGGRGRVKELLITTYHSNPGHHQPPEPHHEGTNPTQLTGAAVA